LTIKGGEQSQLTNMLTVEAGTVTAQHTFEVHPLTITLQSFDQNQYIGTQSDVVALISDHNGNPVGGISTEVSSSYGALSLSSITTDATGIITTSLINPDNPGNAKLSIKVGFSSIHQENYQVLPPVGQAPSLNTRNTLVVGDRVVTGELGYTRYDGVTIGMDYPVQANVQLEGTPGEQLSIEIGDLSDPNLAPVAFFPMGYFLEDGTSVKDAVGLYTATTQNVTSASDTPMGAGQSFQFQQGSNLIVNSVPSLAKPNSVGFRLDVKPEMTDGVILDYAHGVQKLSYTIDRRFKFDIITSEGVISVSSDPVPLNQWHTVAGRYHNGVLRLEVNGAQYDVTGLSDNLQYSVTHQLVVGNNFSGKLNSLRFYDWTYQPLLSLSNGANTENVTLDGSGLATIVVNSNGHMNNQQAMAELSMLRVAIKSQRDRRYVSLLSADYYTDIGAYYINTQHPNAPPINLAGLNRDTNIAAAKIMPVVDFFIKPAYAFDVSIGDVSSWIWEGVNWLVPLEDFYIVAEQLYYYSTDDALFDPVRLSLSALGAMTTIPVLKGLKIPLKSVKKMVRFANTINPKFVRSFGLVVGRSVKKVWDTKSVKVLFDLLPFLLIAGELMADEPSREALTEIIKSVQSEDDFFAWVDYIRLPAEGWVGPGDAMPELEIAQFQQFDTEPSVMYAGNNVLGWLIPSAHASPGIASRLAAVALRKLLKEIKNINGQGGDGYLKRLVDSIKGITKGAKTTDFPKMRKMVHKKQLVAAGIAVGSNMVRRLMKKADNLRISPLAIMAIITYLESRRGECPAADPVCKPLNSRVDDKLNALYGKVFVESLFNPRADYIGGGFIESGHLFHMSMIALKHFEYEGGIKESYIVDIERTRKVQLYARKQNGTIETYGKPYDRDVDMILAGTAGNRAINGNNTWLETKSKKGPPKTSEYKAWDLSKGKLLSSSKRLHKQFFQDRVALKNHGTVQKLANKVEWWFQSFNRRGFSSYKQTDMPKVAGLLRPLLKTGNYSVAKGSLGFSSVNDNNTTTEKRAVENRLKVQSIKSWILGTAKDQLLGEIDDISIRELITDAVNDRVYSQ